MQSGIVAEVRQRMRSAVPLNQFGQKDATAAVEQAHATNVRRVMTGIDKFRQRQLDKRMAAAVELGMGVFEFSRKRSRQHDVAQPQPRVERFTERADVDHRRFGD